MYELKLGNCIVLKFMVFFQYYILTGYLCGNENKIII
jgi:hypothetical protein